MLTNRQIQVLRHVVVGKPNKVIAADIGLAESTVKVHIRSLFKHYKVSNRTMLAYVYGKTLEGRQLELGV